MRRWLLVPLILLAACTGPPDRRAEADQLERSITTMAGVEYASVDYANDITNGTHLDIDVSMPAATDAQIGAVAVRIDELKGDKFAEYDQSTTFVVAPKVTMATGPLPLKSQIAADTRRLRALSAALPNAELLWAVGVLDVRNAPATDDATIAAVRAFAGTEPAKVSVIAPQGVWDVMFPFAPEQERQLRAKLAALPPSVSVDTLSVAADRITQLSVRVVQSAAEPDLRAVIAIAAPEFLRWNEQGQGYVRDAEKFSGSVDVGGCEYGRTAGEQRPEDYYTAEAIALQQRLRDEFDTCG